MDFLKAIFEFCGATVLVSMVIVALLMHNAPRGREDKDGFHFDEVKR